MESLPAALVFDMDGLLLDTERLALDTFVAACRQHRCEPNLAAYYRCIGTVGADSRRILIEGHGAEFPLDAVDATWSELYHDHVDHRAIDVKPGAVELLEWCLGEGIPCALATSTAARLAQTKLTLAGLGHYFEARVTGDAVSRGKPHPEPYLTAAVQLGVAPHQCWALEDSENGVRSAMAAGCRTIQVPDLVAPSAALQRMGHDIVASLVEVLQRLEKANGGTD